MLFELEGRLFSLASEDGWQGCAGLQIALAKQRRHGEASCCGVKLRRLSLLAKIEPVFVPILMVWVLDCALAAFNAAMVVSSFQFLAAASRLGWCKM